MIDFLLNPSSKPVSYKRENQNIIIDADRQNEKKSKGGTLRRNNNKKETFWSLAILF